MIYGTRKTMAEKKVILFNKLDFNSDYSSKL